MDRAIAVLESVSVARGMAMADAAVKRAPVELYFAATTCPGKFLVVVGGGVSAVRVALEAAVEVGREMISDRTFIPNVHPDVFPALSASSCVSAEGVVDLGVLESMAAPAVFEAADAIAKGCSVRLVEIRLGRGMGAKSFVSFAGDSADVERGLRVGVELLSGRGLLVDAVHMKRPLAPVLRFVL